MAVILVGAIIVGSMQTVWMKSPIRDKRLKVIPLSHDLTLQKGSELGHFKLGSTVIVLFGPNKLQWQPEMKPGSPILFGQSIGKINSPLS